MTEEEAQAWLAHRLAVTPEQMEKLHAFRNMVLAENAQQNLISAATQNRMWTRHIVDSAQLLLFRKSQSGSWLDLGTGAGFPGLIVAMICSGPITLVESRRRRAEFLMDSANQLGLGNVTVRQTRLEVLETRKFNTISARAFAPLARIFEIAHRFSNNGTIWLLPKGRSANTELENVKKTWQGVFHVEQSITDPDAGIVVAARVEPEGAR